jgi:hypothetical protein
MAQDMEYVKQLEAVVVAVRRLHHCERLLEKTKHYRLPGGYMRALRRETKARFALRAALAPLDEKRA